MRLPYRIANSFLLLIVGGCVEITVYDSPGVQGIVTDALSGKPIAGATLSVKSKSTVATQTLADGTFALAAATRKLKALPLPYDSVTPGGVLMVSATGYQSKEVIVQGGINNITVV